MSAEGADDAVFITSGVYTDEALRFAHDKPIELVDGAQLAQMFRTNRVQTVCTTHRGGHRARWSGAPEPPHRPRCGQ